MCCRCEDSDSEAVIDSPSAWCLALLVSIHQKTPADLDRGQAALRWINPLRLVRVGGNKQEPSSESLST